MLNACVGYLMKLNLDLVVTAENGWWWYFMHPGRLCSSSLEYWGMKSWSSNIWHLPHWFIFCHAKVNIVIKHFGDWLLSILQLIFGTLVSHSCHIVQEKNVLTWSLFTFTTLVLNGDRVVTGWGEWNIVYSRNILPTWLPSCIKHANLHHYHDAEAC